MLQRLAKKTDSVFSSPLELHRGIIYALLISDDDMELVCRCLPMSSDLFLRQSLSRETNDIHSNQSGQVVVIEEMILRKVRNLYGHKIDSSFLNKIQELGKIWGIPMTQIQTRFILTLYRLGKDAIADNYSIQSSQLDVVYCAKIGVKIASVRLHLSIESLKKSRKHRHLISHLDADVLDWVSDIFCIALRVASF